MSDPNTNPRSTLTIKHTATKMEILAEILVEIEGQQKKYKDSPDVISALCPIEDLVIWWMNTPTVWLEK